MLNSLKGGKIKHKCLLGGAKIMIKLIASDMDGTLLGQKLSISDENVAAIRYAEEHGVKFMIATGRNFDEATPALKEAGLVCPLIAVNGAQAFDENGKTLFTIDIQQEEARQVVKILKEQDLYFEVATTKGIFSDNRPQRLENMATFIANSMPHLTYKMAVAMAIAQLDIQDVHYVEDFEELFAHEDVKILKFIAFSPLEAAALTPARQKIDLIDDLVVTSSFPNNLEVNHRFAQKGIAVQRMAQAYDIPMEKVMTIGDNFNDISMLEVAGVSFAMGNAELAVKEVAKYETDLNTQSGVGKAIRRAVDERLS